MTWKYTKIRNTKTFSSDDESFPIARLVFEKPGLTIIFRTPVNEELRSKLGEKIPGNSQADKYLIPNVLNSEGKYNRDLLKQISSILTNRANKKLIIDLIISAQDEEKNKRSATTTDYLQSLGLSGGYFPSQQDNQSSLFTPSNQRAGQENTTQSRAVNQDQNQEEEDDPYQFRVPHRLERGYGIRFDLSRYPGFAEQAEAVRERMLADMRDSESRREDIQEQHVKCERMLSDLERAYSTVSASDQQEHLTRIKDLTDEQGTILREKGLTCCMTLAPFEFPVKVVEKDSNGSEHISFFEKDFIIAWIRNLDQNNVLPSNPLNRNLIVNIMPAPEIFTKIAQALEPPEPPTGSHGLKAT